MSQAGENHSPIDRLAAIVEQFINASVAGTDQHEQRIIQNEQRIGLPEDAQLRTQAEIATLARIFRENSQEHEQVLEAIRQDIARLDGVIMELRASNQRQERINDYLIRRDGGSDS